MRLLPLILLASCAAQPAVAGCLDTAELAFQGLNIADGIVTSDVLRHGGVEHNPMMGKHPSDLRLFATKAAIGAGHCGLRLWIEADAPGAETAFDYASIGIVGTGLGITIHAKLQQGRR